jgi:hypothetical protein
MPRRSRCRPTHSASRCTSACTAPGPQGIHVTSLPPSSASHSTDRMAQASGFSLHAGVAAEAHQRGKLERCKRLCRYIAGQCGAEARRDALYAAPQTRFRGHLPSVSFLHSKRRATSLLDCPVAHASTMRALTQRRRHRARACERSHLRMFSLPTRTNAGDRMAVPAKEKMVRTDK